MQEDNLKDKTASGLLWGGISHFFQQIIAFALGLVLLNRLSPEEFGIIGLLSIFMGIADIIRERSGFVAALTNRQKFNSDDYNTVFWFNSFAGIFFYAVLFLSAPWIASFFNVPELTFVSRILFLSILIRSFGVAHYAVFYKQLMVKERAKIDLFSLLISGIFAAILAILDFGYWALVCNQVCAAFLQTILRWIYSPWKPSFSFKVQPLKEMMNFSIKLTLSSIITSIQGNIFSAIIGKLGTKADVGYFSQGKKWSDFGAMIITNNLNGIAQPAFSSVAENKERQFKILRKMIRFSAFVSFPLMIGIVFISKEFITIINPEFLPCVPVMQIFCLWGTMAPVLLLYTQLALSMGRSSLFLGGTLICTVLQIGLSFVVLPYGIKWVAFSNVAVLAVSLVVWHVLISKWLSAKLSFILRDMFPYAAVTALVFIFVWFVTIKISNPYLLIVLKVAICSFLYLVIMKLTNSVILKDIIEYFKKRLG